MREIKRFAMWVRTGLSAVSCIEPTNDPAVPGNVRLKRKAQRTLPAEKRARTIGRSF